eukprot:GEZU01000680.1.p1 GENE.GEZU01000680.1~~GEZU01000680.1.p1  ORF type:complete len:178 (-),score=27.94 GEZU01000680.1:17-496(-)
MNTCTSTLIEQAMTLDAAYVPTAEEIAAAEKLWVMNPTDQQLKFNLAWMLSQSKNKEDLRRGIAMLRSLVANGVNPRESVYFLALAHYNLQEYVEARRFAEQILQNEPENRQAKALVQKLDKEIEADGMKGLLAIGAGVAGAGVLVGAAGLLLVSLLKK